MITRRHFIVTTAVTASSPVALQAERPNVRLPLKSLPKVRTLFPKPTDDGRLLLFTDGPETPRQLIKTAALERAFGVGTDLLLQQPDHWRMIDEGWFTEEDLYEPCGIDDPAFCVWCANYRPETEAHDLLQDLFHDQVAGPFCTRISHLGLELAQHPSTPRYATATLDGDWCLARLAAEVSKRTNWILINKAFI